MRLEIQDLYVGYYRDLNILQGVSLTVREQQITTVLGPNGVGKSTLLKAIFGFIKPTQGSITFEGEDIQHIPSYQMVKKGISYIPQHQSVFPQMTVEENLEMGAWTFKEDKEQVRKKIEENYVRFPVLKERRRSPAGELSGGMQRMVELGRTLMTDPKIILVDEPTAGLATMLAREVYEMLIMLKESGITILLVDQNIRQAIKTADYVYVLELGKNRREGPSQDFTDLKKALWM